MTHRPLTKLFSKRERTINEFCPDYYNDNDDGVLSQPKCELVNKLWWQLMEKFP